MNKKALAALFAMIFVLAGCGSQTAQETGVQTQAMDEREVEVQEEKEVVITGELTRKPAKPAETKETAEAKKTGETKRTAKAKEDAETKETKAGSQTAETKEKKETEQKIDTKKTTQAAEESTETVTAQESTKISDAPGTSKSSEGSTSVPAASKPAESQAASGSTGSTAVSKPAEAHTHSFTSVKISDTACESGAVYEERCSCGAVNGTHTEGSGLGHDYQYSGPYVAATCSGGGIDEDKCTRCGATRWTNVPALPHSWTETLTFAGNCNTKSVYTITCSVCGAPGGTREGDYTDDHDWQTFSWQDVDLATGEYITVTKVGCSRCGIEQ